MPAISIITPTYNRAHLLPRVWQSLREQTERDFQWIVVDDGSTDDTTAVVAAFDDPRICYVKQANQGVNGARNRGEVEIAADYVIYLDSDDELYASSTLSEMLDEIRASRPEVAWVSFMVVDSDGNPSMAYLPGDRMEANYTDHVCEQRFHGEFFPVYRRNALAISQWPPFNGLESLRHWRIIRERPTLMLRKPALVVHRPVQASARASGDNLTGARSTIRRAAQMAEATAQLIREHQAAWLQHCPVQLGKYRFYRAMHLALSSSAVRALPDAIGAIRRGTSSVRAKALVLVATLVLPLPLRRALFMWRARVRQ